MYHFILEITPNQGTETHFFCCVQSVNTIILEITPNQGTETNTSYSIIKALKDFRDNPKLGDGNQIRHLRTQSGMTILEITPNQGTETKPIRIRKRWSACRILEITPNQGTETIPIQSIVNESHANFRDNPKLGDGNIHKNRIITTKYKHFRDNPKLGDGNLYNGLFVKHFSILEITPNQGTETILYSNYNEYVLMTILEITPNQGTETEFFQQRYFFSCILEITPNQGTETYTMDCLSSIFQFQR